MSKQKILLIDYDPTSVARVVPPLTRAGYLVEVAKDGIEGLAAYDRLKPALVLVEAMLPRKHGFEVCQEIKRSPSGERTAVMITTAVCRGRKYRTDALQIYGCDEYVEKPVPDDELLSICRRLLSEISAVADGNGDRTAKPKPSEVPALDEMTDDEIEFRLDSLLIEPEAPAADPTPEPEAAPPASPQLPELPKMSIEPAASPPEVPEPPRQTAAPPRASKLPDLAKMSEDEIMNRLDALVDGATAPEPEPQAVAPAPSEPAASVAVAEPKPPAAPEPAFDSIARKRKPRLALIGALVAGLILAAAAVVGFTQGWFSRPVPERVESRPPVATDPPPSFSPEKFRSRVAEAEAVPVQLEDPAAARVEEPPVEASPLPVEPPPTPRRKPAPRPFIEPDPEVAAALRAEIVSEPIRESGADPAPTLAEPPTETPLGVPVRPVLRGDLMKLEDVDSAPVALKKPSPVYDTVARKLRQQGTVLLNVLVDENGNVADVELLGGIPKSRLNDAAIRAVRRWQYRPAEKDGIPVRVWKTEKIAFKL